MKKHVLRITESSWDKLVLALTARADVETAAVILCRKLESESASVLVAESIELVPEQGYLERTGAWIRIAPVALNRLTRRAREEDLSILTVHSHPGCQEPWFSWADDQGDSRLMPAFRVQVPGLPHGSIVLVQGGQACARVFSEAQEEEAVTISIIGRTLRQATLVQSRADERFARQALALGAAGQALLRQLRVAIVGLGGTGSLCALQALHLGVGELLLMDADVVENTNLSRIPGALQSDVGVTPKVDVVTRYADQVGAPTAVRAINRHLVGGKDLAILRECDVVLSCVDAHTPRALMNRLAYEALVPLIDMGSAFRTDVTGAIVSEAGRVVIVGPGRPCLLCWGHVDPDRLREEALPDAERQLLAQDGYVTNLDAPAPSVIAFNTMLAGAAMVELLRIVTGFAGAASPPNRLAFSFGEGTVRRSALAGNRACRVCADNRPESS